MKNEKVTANKNCASRSSKVNHTKLSMKANYKVRHVDHKTKMNKEKKCTPDHSDLDDEKSTSVCGSGMKATCFKIQKYKFKCILTLLVLLFVFSVLYMSFDKCNTCLKNVSDITNMESPTDQHLMKYWIYGSRHQVGHLEHFMLTLKRFGYAHKPLADDWDLLWAQDDPFEEMHSELKSTHTFQRVNHFPGYQHLYDKVAISRSGLKCVPATFQLPEEASQLLEFAQTHKSATYIYKYQDDRFALRDASKLAEHVAKKAIVQEFIDNPLLISETKFEIGIFAIITSINPLRIYIYNSDVGIRSTIALYRPNPKAGATFLTSEGGVVSDLQPLDLIYDKLGGNTKQSLNWLFGRYHVHLEELLLKMEDTIRQYIVGKEKYLIKQTEGFESPESFFEIMQFNFLITTNLKIYLISINPFPNFRKNIYQWDVELYDHLLHNIFGLIGLAPKVETSTLNITEGQRRIQSHEVNLGVYPEECLGSTCKSCGNYDICRLCKKCLKETNKNVLLRAHSEHLNKGECRRIFPPPIDRSNPALPLNFNTYSTENRLMHMWFKGKCLLNSVWCK